MDLSLPSDLQQRVDAQLAAGGFSSPEEVLREAIGALEGRQRGLASLRDGEDCRRGCFGGPGGDV